ncbi:MAG: hypothetical protein Q9159_005850 [Coniocarpon cinnabarinum]
MAASQKKNGTSRRLRSSDKKVVSTNDPAIQQGANATSTYKVSKKSPPGNGKARSNQVELEDLGGLTPKDVTKLEDWWNDSRATVSQTMQRTFNLTRCDVIGANVMSVGTDGRSLLMEGDLITVKTDDDSTDWFKEWSRPRSRGRFKGANSFVMIWVRWLKAADSSETSQLTRKGLHPRKWRLEDREDIVQATIIIDRSVTGNLEAGKKKDAQGSEFWTIQKFKENFRDLERQERREEAQLKKT